MKNLNIEKKLVIIIIKRNYSTTNNELAFKLVNN